MTSIDDLWFLADEAKRSAERADHDVRRRYDPDLEFDKRHRVSRQRFRTLARRIVETGTPYGAHGIVRRSDGAVLLVRHEDVDMWVLPGGEVQDDEPYRETVRREVDEEAGVRVRIDGLAILSRVEVVTEGHRTWGVLPVFSARPESTATSVGDPDGEISAARWFDRLPDDTRDREDIRAWRARFDGD